MHKPRVFISSTIDDFQDLRSSIKYYLEEQGYEVMASSCSGIDTHHSRRSFQSHLKDIETASYFLLLIGTHVGGWYEEERKISFTRAEYRKAYELNCAGKLKIITMVRSEVSRSTAERKEIEKYLESVDIEHDQKTSIANFPGRAIEDWGSISGFLEEIGRNNEAMEDVTNGRISIPSNPIYEFSNFRDVVNVLNMHVNSIEDLDEISIRRHLKYELFGILRQSMVCQGRAGTIKASEIYHSFRSKTNVQSIRRGPGPLRIEMKEWRSFLGYAVEMVLIRFATPAINHALESYVFSELEHSGNEVVDTSFSMAMKQLKYQIDSFNNSNSSYSFCLLLGSPHDRESPDGKEYLLVDCDHLVLVMKAYAHLANIIDLSRAILRNLEGWDLEIPVLLPSSPLIDSNEIYEKSMPTVDEVWTYVRSSR